MKTSRRSFLKISGCLTIGFSISGFNDAFSSGVLQELPESLKRNPNINSWIEILDNGRVRIFTGKMELGQGVRTAIAQVAAEELQHNIKLVEVVLADTNRTPDEGYTAGSGSMEQSAMAVRYASAAAKDKLLELASKKLNVPIKDLVLSNGIIQAKNGITQVTFETLLAGKQITSKVSSPVNLKPKTEYTLVGKKILRDDIRDMVVGKPIFIQDLRFPGMVHARVVRPPTYSATLNSVDKEKVTEKYGDVKIIRDGNFLGVIAEDEFTAIQAQNTLRQECTWSQTSLKPGSEAELHNFLRQLPAETERVLEKGNISSSNFLHRATYFKPYIMHGSIGPSCAVALWDNNKLHVWSHSQGVFPLRKALSEMLRLQQEVIHVTGAPGAGCYGHNGADDVAADAALLAISYPGKHVRLQWMREDEHLWEPYGSAMIMEVSANLDVRGKITDWKYELWSDNHSTRPGGKAGNLLAARYIDKAFDPPSGGYAGGAYRNSQPYYDFPNQQIDAHIVKTPLRISALRSLGAYANIFAIESFMDELAEKAKIDPYEFRLIHSSDPRSKAVLARLREMTRNVKTGKNEGIGIAFSRYKNYASYCAAAALVVLDETPGSIRVKKMWSVIDAGETINIDGVMNQTEGGLIQAASWTLMEEVKFNNKHVTSADWSIYPIIRFADVPEVEVEVINRPSEEVLGAGEAAQGPASAAIANAIYQASGKRIRDLPVLKRLLS